MFLFNSIYYFFYLPIPITLICSSKSPASKQYAESRQTLLFKTSSTIQTITNFTTQKF